jgi:hypothetical protein
MQYVHRSGTRRDAGADQTLCRLLLANVFRTHRLSAELDEELRFPIAE